MLMERRRTGLLYHFSRRPVCTLWPEQPFDSQSPHAVRQSEEVIAFEILQLFPSSFPSFLGCGCRCDYETNVHVRLKSETWV
jgi:hypothetical protein